MFVHQVDIVRLVYTLVCNSALFVLVHMVFDLGVGLHLLVLVLLNHIFVLADNLVSVQVYNLVLVVPDHMVFGLGVQLHLLVLVLLNHIFLQVDNQVSLEVCN